MKILMISNSKLIIIYKSLQLFRIKLSISLKQGYFFFEFNSGMKLLKTPNGKAMFQQQIKGRFMHYGWLSIPEQRKIAEACSIVESSAVKSRREKNVRREGTAKGKIDFFRQDLDGKMLATILYKQSSCYTPNFQVHLSISFSFIYHWWT